MHKQYHIWSIALAFMVTIGACRTKEDMKKELMNATRLKWEEFRGTPPDDHNRSVVASTSTKLVLNCDDGKDVDTYTACRVEWFFDGSSSWVRHDVWLSDSVRVLEHESGHLRLTAIYAKKLQVTVNRNRYDQWVDRSMLEVLKTDARNELDEVQAVYDRETAHSLNVMMQRKWDSLIAEDLVLYYNRSADLEKWRTRKMTMKN